VVAAAAVAVAVAEAAEAVVAARADPAVAAARAPGAVEAPVPGALEVPGLLAEALGRAAVEARDPLWVVAVLGRAAEYPAVVGRHRLALPAGTVRPNCRPVDLAAADQTLATSRRSCRVVAGRISAPAHPNSQPEEHALAEGIDLRRCLQLAPTSADDRVSVACQLSVRERSPAPALRIA
jgi:hypothetical protein